MTATSEIWLPISGYEGNYEVSNQGRIRSLDRLVNRGVHKVRVRGRVLQPAPSRNGHLHVNLHKDGTSRVREVHVIVAQEFIGSRPPGLEVRHLNGMHADNRVENLRYGTRSENAFDQVLHGVHNKASQTHCKRGHEFTPENTYMNGGRRVCIHCRAEYKRAWRAKRRQLIAVGADS